MKVLTQAVLRGDLKKRGKKRKKGGKEEGKRGKVAGERAAKGKKSEMGGMTTRPVRVWSGPIQRRPGRRTTGYIDGGDDLSFAAKPPALAGLEAGFGMAGLIGGPARPSPAARR